MNCVSVAGEAESEVRKIFQRASRKAPCIVVIDDLEQLCPHRGSDGTASDVQQRLTSCLLNIIDGPTALRGVFIIAASSSPNTIDAAMRRPGRLDREIELTVPSPADREAILLSTLTSLGVYIADEAEFANESEDGNEDRRHIIHKTCVSKVAKSSHGMVASDLVLVCKEAFISASNRVYRYSDVLQDVIVGDDVRLVDSDLVAGVGNVVPSAIREVAVDVPCVRWSDIGGMDSVKTSLREV